MWGLVVESSLKPLTVVNAPLLSVAGVGLLSGDELLAVVYLVL